MAMVRKTLAELMANPPQFTPEDRARLEAMTDEEVEQAALDDPDAQPATEEQLDRGVFGRDVRMTRKRLGLTPEAFADALGLPVVTLRSWEQGRVNPDPAARALIRIVSREPEAALRALAA
jgi:putative transcriptional regulator